MKKSIILIIIILNCKYPRSYQQKILILFIFLIFSFLSFLFLINLQDQQGTTICTEGFLPSFLKLRMMLAVGMAVRSFAKRL